MKQINQNLKDVRIFINNNDYENAKQILQGLIIENNNDYRVYFLLALTYHKEGSFNKAINNYLKTIELNSNDVESYVNLSLIYNDLGKYEKGANFYKKAYDIYSSNEDRNAKIDMQNLDQMFAKQHASLGDLYLRYNRLHDAELEFKKSHFLDETNNEVILKLAQTMYRKDNKKQAFKLLNELKKRDYKYYEARVKLGHLYFLEGNYGEAVEEWDQVLKENPGNVDAKMYKKMMYEKSILA